jgi:hypothetical protein
MQQIDLVAVTTIGAFATGITVLVLIVWGISIFTNARTRREAQRLELHARLLERIGSTREFAEFLATDNGQRFLNGISPPTPPQWRLVWSLQAGIVVFAIGAAIFLTGGFFLVGSNFGWMIMGIGVALIAATGASWRVARAFGLVGRLREMPPMDPPASA